MHVYTRIYTHVYLFKRETVFRSLDDNDDLPSRTYMGNPVKWNKVARELKAELLTQLIDGLISQTLSWKKNAKNGGIISTDSAKCYE